jgi:hypothetical protein
MAGKRLALLIANAEYKHDELRKLNTPKDDVRALEVLFTRADIGGYQVQVLIDGTKGAIERAIDQMFAKGEREDTVLIFFAGHGLKHENGKLYFAATDTEPEYLGSTAVSASWLMEQMQNSRVGYQIVLLDCCFGGAFARGIWGRGDDRVESGKALQVPDLKLEGRGQVVITSADAMQFALEGGALDGKPPASHFVRALTEGLETGEADCNPRDGRITIDELASYLVKKLKILGSPQRPSKWIFGAIGDDLLFALNPRANFASDMPPAATKPLNLITIIDQRLSDRTQYLYQVDFRTLGIFKTFASPWLRANADRDEDAMGLYKEIEACWMRSGHDVVAFNEKLRAYGVRLFEDLFPEPLQRVLWDNRDRISQILLVSTDSFIPWEIVHLKEPNQPISDGGKFLGQLGLVRWLDENWPTETLQVTDGCARYLVPDYARSDWKLPQAQQEIRFLEERFGATAVMEPREALLADGTFDLLHFAGRGFVGRGTAESLDIFHLRIMFGGRIMGAKYSANRPIVVFNVDEVSQSGTLFAVISGFARAFIMNGAGAFVGNLWSVNDSPSRTFIETWYDALISGSTLAEAVIRAREAAQEAGDATWLAYTVYGHPYAKLVRRGAA